jgi:hypothetical protein
LSRVEISRLFTRFFLAKNACKTCANILVLDPRFQCSIVVLNSKVVRLAPVPIMRLAAHLKFFAPGDAHIGFLPKALVLPLATRQINLDHQLIFLRSVAT